MQLAAGSIFQNRYEILKCLGIGGFGTVYKARQIDADRLVALKLMHAVNLADEESVKRFRREARSLARLQHKNIVTIYHCGFSEEGIPFAAMEYLRGKTIKAVLNEEGWLDPERAVHILAQVLDALSFAHSEDIVHRDLKPENIMLVAEPEPDTAKLVDFGLAKLLGKTGAATEKLTRTGLLIGSINYMSPEQARGLPADQRSDVYAMGCIFYEMLTGVKPFKADNPVGLMYKHCNESARPFSEVAHKRNIPAHLEAVCKKAMEKDPGSRFQSVSEFSQALTPGFLNNAGPGTCGTAPDAASRAALPAAEKKGKWRPGICALLLLLALGGTAALLAPFDSSRHSAPVKVARLHRCSGVVYFLAINPTRSKCEIKELHIETNDGLVKVHGRIPARAMTDLQIGKVWQIEYTGEPGNGDLISYRSTGDKPEFAGASNLVSNYCLNLSEQNHDLMLETLSEGYREKAFAGLSHKQLTLKLFRTYPPEAFLTRLGSYLELPQCMRILSFGANEIKILLNTDFLFKKSQEYLVFDLKRQAQAGEWKIDGIQPVSRENFKTLEKGADGIPGGMLLSDRFQHHSCQGTIYNIAKCDLTGDLLEAGITGTRIKSVHLHTPAGKLLELSANTICRSPEEAQIGSRWKCDYTGDDYGGELESYECTGMDVELSRAAKLVEYYSLCCFQPGFDPRPFLMNGTNSKINYLKTLDPEANGMGVEQANSSLVKIVITSSTLSGATFTLCRDKSANKSQSPEFGDWKIQCILSNHRTAPNR
jgi:hypothetical protein